MKPLDWRTLLREHGVPHIERGPNVKRGELNIKCPFCGSADPSFHMGLNLESGFWACWRNNTHRGKSPVRLIAQLLQVPYWRARQIAGLSDSQEPDPDGFDAVAARIMGRDKLEQVEHVRRDFLSMPREFEELRDRGAGVRFFSYLCDIRRFGVEGTEILARDYNVRFSKIGPWTGRVILPYYVEGELVAWTGRAIADATLRYRDLDRDDCLVPIKETLFNHDCVIDGGRVLNVVEGPMDALKIDVFGAEYGVRAVALSTNSISEQQLYLLEAAAENFDEVNVMLDNATTLGVVDSMRMRQSLASLRNVKIRPVPYGLKDAALMTPQQARHWASAITR